MAMTPTLPFILRPGASYKIFPLIAVLMHSIGVSLRSFAVLSVSPIAISAASDLVTIPKSLPSSSTTLQICLLFLARTLIASKSVLSGLIETGSSRVISPSLYLASSRSMGCSKPKRSSRYLVSALSLPRRHGIALIPLALL